MKALSIQQPWAWLIVNGHKDIENRTWPTHFRGVFLVHAGKKFDRDGYRYLRSRHDIIMPEEKDFSVGGIVGSAELIDCVDSSASQWFSGPHGFVLKEGLPLPFESLPGSLRFFTVSPDLLGNLVGTVIKYDPAVKAAKVRLFYLISVGDHILVRGGSNWSQEVGQIFRDGDQITHGVPGESVWIKLERAASRGDHIYLSDAETRDEIPVPKPPVPKPPIPKPPIPKPPIPKPPIPKPPIPKPPVPKPPVPKPPIPKPPIPKQPGPDPPGPKQPHGLPKESGPKPDLPDPNHFPLDSDETKKKGAGSFG